MRRNIYIIIIGIILIGSCKTDKKKSIDNLLIGEWMLDSISGTFNQWDRDFIFITDNRAFWKFTYWNDRYLIDSCFEVVGDQVFNENLKVYKIKLLDTFNLSLTDNSGNIFFYKNQSKEWDSDYKSDLQSFISSHLTHEQTSGWWKLKNATFRPFKLVNYPDKISDFTMFLNTNGDATIFIDNLIDSTINYTWKADSMALCFSLGCVVGHKDNIVTIDKNTLSFVLHTRREYIPTTDTLEFVRCNALIK